MADHPPSADGGRKKNFARRSLAAALNGPAGGAAPADNVIVPGTPSSGESDDEWTSVAHCPPPAHFRPIASAPPGAVNFQPVARDPRLLVSAPPGAVNFQPVARDPRPERPSNASVGTSYVRHMPSALRHRADAFTTAAPEMPRKRRREEEVDETEDFKEIKTRAKLQKVDGEFMTEQKKFLLDCLKTEFDGIKDEYVFIDVVNFGAKLLRVVEADTKNVENMASKAALVDTVAISNEKEWIELSDAADAKLQAYKEHNKVLETHGKEGASIVKALVAEVILKADLARKADHTAKNAATAANLKHATTTRELRECKALLAKRTEVLDMFKQVSVIPYCGKCMAKVGFTLSDSIYRMTCGKLRCNFCKQADVCERAVCDGTCRVAYEITAEDYLEEIEFARKHVMDNYEPNVIDCQNEYEDVPPALDAFRIKQHKHLSDTRF
jgi:hypothetical protein